MESVQQNILLNKKETKWFQLVQLVTHFDKSIRYANETTFKQ